MPSSRQMKYDIGRFNCYNKSDRYTRYNQNFVNYIGCLRMILRFWFLYQILKNARDAHFSNISKFARAEEFIQRLDSSEDIINAVRKILIRFIKS